MTVIEVFTHILTNAGMIAISITIVMLIEDLNNKHLLKKNNHDGEISAIVLLLFMLIVYSLELSLYYTNLY